MTFPFTFTFGEGDLAWLGARKLDSIILTEEEISTEGVITAADMVAMMNYFSFTFDWS